MNCDVCGLPGTPLKGVRMSAKGYLEWIECSPGVACSPECATFIFVRPSDETPDEKKLTKWRWAQRRAQARGLPFNEPPPMDEGERLWVLFQSRRRRWAA